jgi:hypothetical protein
MKTRAGYFASFARDFGAEPKPPPLFLLVFFFDPFFAMCILRSEVSDSRRRIRGFYARAEGSAATGSMQA